MKILQISYSLTSGGAERLIVDLVNQFSKNHEVHLLTILDENFDDNSFYKKLLSEKVIFHCAKLKSGVSLNKIYILNKKVREIAPDIVHLHGINIIYLFLPSIWFYRRPKYVETLHNRADIIFSKWYSFAALINYRIKLVKMVTISDENKRSLEYSFKIFNSKLIYNGRSQSIPSSTFDLVRKEVNSYLKSKDDIVFIHVGRFSIEKNQKVFIDTFNELYKRNRPFILMVLGKGFFSEAGNELRKLANPNIYFLGTKINITDYFRCSDAFCLTSIYEGMPITLIEALDCMCVPICTPTSGVIDVIIDKKNGFISTDFSTSSYLNKIEEYIDCNAIFNKTELKQTYLERFSIEKCAKSYSDLYYDLISSTKI